MAYRVRFKGTMRYMSPAAVEVALARFDGPSTSTSEVSVLTRADLVVKDTRISIDFDGTMPALCWYGSKTALFKLAHNAARGSVTAVFEADRPEKITPGQYPP